MKFINKLASSVTAKLASAMILLSSSSVFAEDLKIPSALDTLVYGSEGDMITLTLAVVTLILGFAKGGNLAKLQGKRWILVAVGAVLTIFWKSLARMVFG
jgi:hypothetical protein